MASCMNFIKCPNRFDIRPHITRQIAILLELLDAILKSVGHISILEDVQNAMYKAI